MSHMEQEMLIPPEPLSSPPVLVGLCVMFCRSLSVILRFTDSDLFLYLQTFLHSLIHSFESCFHAQDRQLVQLYGVKFVAVTYNTSRCEMTSLRTIYRHLVVFNRYSCFHYYLNLDFML